jgi:hypothetical protein
MEDCALQVCVEPVDESGRGNRSCYNCCQLRLIKSSQACQIILPLRKQVWTMWGRGNWSCCKCCLLRLIKSSQACQIILPLRKEPMGPLCSTISNSKSLKTPGSQCIHKGHKGKKCRQSKLQLTIPLARPEAEFLGIFLSRLFPRNLNETLLSWIGFRQVETEFTVINLLSLPYDKLFYAGLMFTQYMLRINIIQLPADVGKEISLGFPSDELLAASGISPSCQHLFQARKWAPRGVCWPAIRYCQVRRRRVGCSCLRCLQLGLKGHTDTDDRTPMPMALASKRMTSYTK